jgi:hypothetical protein
MQAQINARAEVLRMERELEDARKKLTMVNQRRYQTDSEQSEQSGSTENLSKIRRSNSKSWNLNSNANKAKRTTLNLSSSELKYCFPE